MPEDLSFTANPVFTERFLHGELRPLRHQNKAKEMLLSLS
jgi:hypothetical protein